MFNVKFGVNLKLRIKIIQTCRYKNKIGPVMFWWKREHRGGKNKKGLLRNLVSLPPSPNTTYTAIFFFKVIVGITLKPSTDHNLALPG